MAALAQYYWKCTNNIETAIQWHTKYLIATNPTKECGITRTLFSENTSGSDTILKCYTQLADLGNGLAMFHLGKIYFELNEFSLAANWYSKAAAKGSSEAYFELALMYLHGRGVEPNEQTAVSMCQKAAEKGYLEAEQFLALLDNPVQDLDKFLKTSIVITETAKPEVLCCICMSATKNILCLPCRHLSTCWNCSQQFLNQKNECPLCRKVVKQIVKVFW
jgi:tetratricopeptide (TPR) repeat protein